MMVKSKDPRSTTVAFYNFLEALLLPTWPVKRLGVTRALQRIACHQT